MQQRIKWIDVARCFGIFAVYLGHFGTEAGRMYSFLYTHHVPLFFFLSGCLAPREDMPLMGHVKKTVRGLLLPWFTFAIAAAVFDTIYMDSDLYSLLGHMKQVALGTIVDHYVAGGLWFFVGLAGVRLLFWFLRKLRNPVVILAICLVLFLVEAEYPIPVYYNIHRVLRFVIYYAVGFYVFPYLSGALAPGTQRGRILLALSGLFSLGFSALVYFGKKPLGILGDVPLVGSLTPIVQALAIIWLYLIVAKCLENVEIFNQIGRKTLYLCGSEYFIRQLLKSFVRLFGLELSYPRPICAWLCAALALHLAHRYLVPVAEKLIAFLQGFPDWLCREAQPDRHL